MDRMTKYQNAILELLEAYSEIEYTNLEGSNFLIADKERNRYQVVTMGWQDGKFVHDCPIHLDIINEKIWVQRNMTEWDLGEMFNERGISNQEIVLGFLKPSTRVFSDYAVA